MDKFEQLIQQMEKMTEKQMAKMIENSKSLCVCPSCPTYNECAGEKKELLFCALGKSPACITNGVECICPDCPITSQMGLKHNLFCVQASERELRGI